MKKKTDPSTESITELLGSLGKLREGGKGTPDRKSVFNGKWTLAYTHKHRIPRKVMTNSPTAELSQIHI